MSCRPGASNASFSVRECSTSLRGCLVSHSPSQTKSSLANNLGLVLVRSSLGSVYPSGPTSGVSSQARTSPPPATTRVLSTTTTLGTKRPFPDGSTLSPFLVSPSSSLYAIRPSSTRSCSSWSSLLVLDGTQTIGVVYMLFPIVRISQVL